MLELNRVRCFSDCRVAFALLLGLSCGLAFAVPQCELNGEAVNPSNGNTTAGKSGLMRCTDDGGAVRLREQTLLNGNFEGPVRYVMHSGERREYSLNAKGNRDGVAREWDAQGVLRREETLDNGDAKGVQKRFSASGHLEGLDFVVDRQVVLSMGYLDDGTLSELRCAPASVVPQDQAVCGHQGQPSAVTLYRAPGKMSGTASFLAGKLVRRTETNATGGLVRSDEVKRVPGEPDRRIRRVYYPSGKMRSETDLVQGESGDRRREGMEREWAESGQLTQQTAWVAGRKQRIEQWYFNGQRKLVQAIRREGSDEFRETARFRDDGRRASETVERNGQLFGWQRYFSEAGALLREDEHDPRGVMLRRKIYNAEGTLDKEERFLEDGSRI